jgi:hypothetical protein
LQPAEKQPNGVLDFAQLTSIGNAFNVIPTFPFLRRIRLHTLVEEMLNLNHEGQTKGTLFGIPVTPSVEGYNDAEAKKAISELDAKLDKYCKHWCGC